MTQPQRGDVWWADLPEKGRPALILTRDAGDGMPVACAATLDNVTTVDRSFLTQRITRLGEERMAGVCVALATATACR